MVGMHHFELLIVQLILELISLLTQNFTVLLYSRLIMIMIMINYKKKASPVNPVHIQFTTSIIKKIMIISPMFI